MNAIDLTPTLTQSFADQPQVVLAYLFGSYGRGAAHAHSDVDVAVLLAPSEELDYFAVRLKLMGELSSLLQRNEIDVAILNQTPLTLNYRVVREGRLLHCADDDQRIQFVWQTTMRYLDFEPFLRLYEQTLINKAKQGLLPYGHNPHHGALDRYYQLRQRLKGTSPTDL